MIYQVFIEYADGPGYWNSHKSMKPAEVAFDVAASAPCTKAAKVVRYANAESPAVIVRSFGDVGIWS
jgi:hypothetical protein